MAWRVARLECRPRAARKRLAPGINGKGRLEHCAKPVVIIGVQVEIYTVVQYMYLYLYIYYICVCAILYRIICVCMCVRAYFILCDWDCATLDGGRRPVSREGLLLTALLSLPPPSTPVFQPKGTDETCRMRAGRTCAAFCGKILLNLWQCSNAMQFLTLLRLHLCRCSDLKVLCWTRFP